MSLHPIEEKKPASPFHEETLKRSEFGGNEEEQNYCRICRGEGTTTQPLYYPCKCSGSIKFVHQECLMEWLSHSQKKYCELCKSSFRFTKLYDRSMPARLPFPLFVRQLTRHGAREFARWTRYLIVGVIWTCCLPWCIRQVWRGFLWLADGSAPGEVHVSEIVDATLNTSSANSARQASQTLLANLTLPAYLDRATFVLPPMLISLGDIARIMLGQGLIGRIVGLFLAIFIPQLRNVGVASNAENSTTEAIPMAGRSPSLLSDVRFISSWSGSRIVDNTTVDIIEGQLICVLLVTAFVLVFLIREWVINQQPILNMPDPDAVDNAPQERQAENERPRLGLLRPRNPRVGGVVNVEAEGAVAVDPAARPIAIPRRRRALTDDNILNDTGNAIDRPSLPMRSRSVADTQDGTAEEAIGESSAITNDPVNRPIRRHSTSSHQVNENAASKTLGPKKTEVEDVAEPMGEAESAVTSLDTEGLHAYDYDEQQTAIDEVLSKPLTRRVSFATQIIEEAANRSGQLEHHETATDSDEPVIPTPDSSNDTDLLQPAEELVDADLQGVLFEEPAREGADEAITDDEQAPPGDDSLLGRVSKWLWPEIETETQPGTNAGGMPQAEAHDEERIVDDVNAEAPFVPVHNRDVPQAPPLPPVVAVPPAEPREPNNFLGIDLNDAGDEAEDLDGVLELLGMEGPVFGMVQNVIFSLLLITLTLMMSFWFPYMWGKIALLFLSQPATMLVRAPMFVLSRTADIVVDIIFFVTGLAGFIFNQPVKIIKALISGISPALGSVLDTTTIEGLTLDLSQKSGARLERTLTSAILGLRPDVPNFSIQSHHALIFVKTYIKEAIQSMTLATVQLQKVLTTDRRSCRFLLVSFGQILRSAPDYFRQLPHFTQLAVGFARRQLADVNAEPILARADLDLSLAQWNNEDRILAVILGYTLFAVAGIVFLEIAHLFLGLNENEKVEGYFADSLRQAGGVMKVIVIIGIEMLVFPLYCGLLLDIALLPLFVNATVASRIAFIMRSPLTGIFIHWFVGTCYMFHFALFVSICRKIMRKGVLYFIRDPDDPTFHPVRDVLERPVPAQLGKIAFSALVYGGLVTVCLGGVVWSLDWVGGVLPIQWSTPEPRLAFPVDIVFYNFLLPFILRKAEPSKKISTMYNWWFRGCASSLRLTNFLFGEEQKKEQYTYPKGLPWNLFTKDTLHEPQRDGTYVRAPASDSVRIPKGRDVFLRVTENNERLDGQPDSDFGMHGKKDPQFTKVYLPPNFKSRITTFIVLLWLFAATTGVAFTIGPLLVGRKITQLLSQSNLPPNDLYAFTVGIHIFAAVGYAIVYARPARDYLRARLNSSGKQVLVSVLHVFGLAYLGIFTTLVLPFAMSLITELYIHRPLFDMLELVNQEKVKEMSSSTSASTDSAALNNDKILGSATIFILQSWTVGLLYLRLLFRVLTLAIDPTSRPARAIRAITRNGIFQADIPLASRAFVLPITTVCLVVLLFPLSYMKVIITLFEVGNTDKQMRMYRFAYPLFLWMMANYGGVVLMRKKVERWRVKIRDEVYLIGERLHNFQEPRPRVRKGVAESSKGKEKAL